MAAVSVFQTLKARVERDGGRLPHERRAMYWFQNYATALTRWQRDSGRWMAGTEYQHLKDWKYTKQLVSLHNLEVGKMYFFMYQAKHELTLPYWDRLPLCIPLDIYDNGFLGLNLHYLDYRDRAKLFDGLYAIATMKTNDFKAKIRVTYDYLKGASRLSAFKPCVKQYLYHYVRSGGAIQVGVTEWDTALFLPCEMFQKKTKTYVWKKSKEQF
jgi:hypothetical protein